MLGLVCMNAWLCPIKTRSWQIIKKEGIFGVPTRAQKTMKQVRVGDLLVFHVFGQTKGIVAIYKVVSDVYRENRDVWGKNRYPLRVKIELFRDLVEDGSDPLPLSSIFGGNSMSGIVVEPFLKNIWVSKIEKNTYNKLAKLIAKKSKGDNSAESWDFS